MKTFLVLCSVCCLAPSALGQHWAGPFQLSNDTFADINPSACREWVGGTATRLVWQSNRNGDWDIYSRLCYFYNGNGWEAEMPVCTDSGDDITPAIATHFEAMGGWKYWCVWERRESPTTGRIMAASADAYDTAWSVPVEIGRCLHTSGDSARPFIMAIEQLSSDTLWAAWTGHDTDGWSVWYSRGVNSIWSPPEPAVVRQNSIRHARLGRGKTVTGAACPLLVWEEAGDILYSEYVSGAWTTPQEVAHSAAMDRNPDVMSYCSMPFELGPWITWESARDGDTAVYGTAMDTFSIGRRWCDSTGAGNNRTPCGTPAVYTVDDWVPAAVVWVTDRNGNPDVYARTMGFFEDEYVDDNPATDINPTMTTLGLTMHWCCWQSNRSGNWDIWGSYIYATGVEESRKPQAASYKPQPTILSGASGVKRLASCVVFDATGRRVLNPKPGVYFVREAQAQAQAQAVRKVIIQR
jgi:hypothetical protein